MNNLVYVILFRYGWNTLIVSTGRETVPYCTNTGLVMMSTHQSDCRYVGIFGLVHPFNPPPLTYDVSAYLSS